MNTEKLLSEPVAYTDAEELRFPHATSDMWPVPLGFGKDVPLYSQDYVSALDDVAQYWIGQSAEWKERAEAADPRIAELEAIATEYAGKFQKAQDAAKHLVIMNDSAQAEIAHLKTLLATPVRLHPQGDAAMTSNKQLIELKAAADKYSLTLKAHRENPRDANALVAWDLATSEFCDLTNNNEASIIIDLLAALEEAQKESVYFCNLNARKNERIAELERARFIAWPGNMFAPVLARIKVDVKRRDGSVSVGLSGGNVVWYHQDRPDDVVAFALSMESDA